MSKLSPEHLRSLIQPDRVHRDVYTDPALFELEMQQLFGKAWLVLGHDSQVKQPGDYFLTEMARQPVIVARDQAGTVRVFHNRCTHRGAMVCHEPRGNVRQFTCAYHGWTFETSGELKWVPLRSGYEPQADQRLASLALPQVARVALYRGFIFASLAAQGPSLQDSLGHMLSSFDDMVDRAPDGEVEVAGGVFKHAYNGNWKLVLENHLDGVHPNYVHASSVQAAREGPDPGMNAGGAAGGEPYHDIAIRQMRQNGAPDPVWESIGVWTTAHGHGYLGDYHDDSRLVSGLDNPVHAEYHRLLSQRLGQEKARKVLAVTRWNSVIYPNCSFMGQFRQLRIVHPLAVDRSVVYTYSFRLKGAPEQMFRDTVAFSNVVNGTASWVLTDDLEVYERAQRGLAGGGTEWIYVGRGLGRDVPDSEQRLRGATGTSEVFIRNQFAAWLEYMTGESAGDSAGESTGNTAGDNA